MNNETEDTAYDYRFLDYRLDQLELNLRKGQEKLEKEYKESNKTILETLTAMQEGQNEQNRTIVELIQRQKNVEEKMKCIDKLKEVATKNTTKVHELERRIDIYKQVLVGVAISAVSALVIGVLKFL